PTSPKRHGAKQLTPAHACTLVHEEPDMFTSRTYVESRSGTTKEELLKQLRALHVYARTDADFSRTKATIQKSITDTENKYQRLNQELEEWYAEEERLQSEINSYEAELAHREALATERNAQLIAAQNDRAAIDREVQRLVQARDNRICAGAVVAMLVTLAIIIAIALSETGNGSPVKRTRCS
ncbi:MAG: hypothetical protein K2Q25_03675, partial [Mycobacteriaceae bacterium]|nr:hypothetical protein [Mycobacteriaceae bacterium]